jgi:hypothetical protein
MSDATLDAIRDLIQEDINGRGLRTDPAANLVNAFPGDFEGACRSLVAEQKPAVAIVTGFLIPHAQPPAAETDGPLGAIFIARALTRIGFRIAMATDEFCRQPLEAGLEVCGLRELVPLITLPAAGPAWHTFAANEWPTFLKRHQVTHLLALERAGPSHTPESLRRQPGSKVHDQELFAAEVPAEHQDRCHTMVGRDVTDFMAPAHLLFERARHERITTIGIGDGGNEIGMGKIPWAVIRLNIPNGAVVACRVPTDFLIVCGVSNWGAYGLAAGLMHLRHAPAKPYLFDPEREREVLHLMIQRSPLVDGVRGKPTLTVDGLNFQRYAAKLQTIGALIC